MGIFEHYTIRSSGESIRVGQLVSELSVVQAVLAACLPIIHAYGGGAQTVEYSPACLLFYLRIIGTNAHSPTNGASFSPPVATPSLTMAP